MLAMRFEMNSRPLAMRLVDETGACVRAEPRSVGLFELVYSRSIRTRPMKSRLPSGTPFARRIPYAVVAWK